MTSDETVNHGLRDLLRILAETPTPPTISLWLAESDEEDTCDRCSQSAPEWYAAMPMEGDDGSYEGTYRVAMCSTCIASLVVRADEMTVSAEDGADPDDREIWPLGQ